MHTQIKLPSTQAQEIGYAYKLVDLDRKHFKVSKTVKIVSEYNRTDLAGENLRKIHSGSRILFCCHFLFNAITVSIDLGLKLQFLCLPLDVNSL